MDRISQTLVIMISDKFFFWLFQTVFIFIFLHSAFMEKINENSGRTVKRGKEGQYALYYIYGILSVILLQIVSSSTAIKDFTTFFIILNSFILTYLCFFNSWSRNKIIGIYNKFKNKIEQL